MAINFRFYLYRGALNDIARNMAQSMEFSDQTVGTPENDHWSNELQRLDKEAGLLFIEASKDGLCEEVLKQHLDDKIQMERRAIANEKTWRGF